MTRSLTTIRIVGARPQFMQAAALRREMIRRGHREVLVHTGQHYDDAMSRVFFQELDLPPPDLNLNVGSAGPSTQTGRMLVALESVLAETPFDAVIVDGDTNSTLAGALAAAKAHLPLVHIEAGLRSFDRDTPEEVNRIVADQVGSLLCAPTPTAVENLTREGLADRTVLTGDLLYDSFLHCRGRQRIETLSELGVSRQEYLLATVHRQENTDDAGRFESIVTALGRMPMPVLMPVHPRTAPLLEKIPQSLRGALRPEPPQSYLAMLALIQNARCVLTDSGGVQREAFFAGVPGVVLRDVSEWAEQMQTPWCVLGGWQTDRICQSAARLMNGGSEPPVDAAAVYGGGRASERVVDAVEERWG
jgi:UDP-N-acetylglucosamine 2-epimerase